MDFDSIPDESAALGNVAEPQRAPSSTTSVLPSFDEMPDQSFDAMPDQSADFYKTNPEIQKAALERVGFGTIGETATTALEKAFGAKNEDIEGRRAALAEDYPIMGPALEAASFMLPTSVIGHGVGMVGEGIGAASGIVKAIPTIGQKIAAGALRGATEMGLIQADSEASKHILDPSLSVGNSVANVGLSGVLGGVTGGGLGGIFHLIDNPTLTEARTRLSARVAGLNPPELAQEEFGNVIQNFFDRNDEMFGPNGLKSAALQNIMPEASPEITTQAQGIVTELENKIATMRSNPDNYPTRLVNKLENDLNTFKEKAFGATPTATPGEGAISGGGEELFNTQAEVPTRQEIQYPPQQEQFNLQTPLREPPTAPPDLAASPGQIFDAANDLKKSLWDYSKGNWGPNELPRWHDAYDFVNDTKQMGGTVKQALEDSNVWGPVADFQKELNSATKSAIDNVKQIRGKFMFFNRDTGQWEPSSDKFATYFNKNGRATTVTDRQKMMSSFLDSMEGFQKASDSAFEKAGIESPYAPIEMGALKDSIQRQSVGNRIGDAWYNLIHTDNLGGGIGAAAGGVGGSVSGVPYGGIGGAYLGKQVLGPVIGATIRPILEKGVNISAWRDCTTFGEKALRGSVNLIKASGSLFLQGSKTIPKQFMPDKKDIEDLKKQVNHLSQNPTDLENISGHIGDYWPEHAMTIAQTAATAVNYLASQKPQITPPVSPLDSPIQPTRAQEMQYERTLEIANQPLSAFQHIKDGTLLPQDVNTIKTIYPTFYSKMCDEIMTAITNHLSADETIPYQLRQTLSMFLGQPLDSTMTPASIQAAQGVFAQQQTAQQPVGKTKKSTSKLAKLSDNLQTVDQSRTARLNKA